MKANGRFRFVIGLAVAISVASVHAQEQKETLGDKLKKLFTRPTPSASPTPRRHHRSSPSPTETPSIAGSSSPIPSYGETPEPSQAENPRTQYFEPVRPINPGPSDRTLPRTFPAPQTMPTPAETATVVPEPTLEEIPESRPVPSLPEMFSPVKTPTPRITREESSKEESTPSPPETIPIPNAETARSPEAIPSAQSPTPTSTFSSPVILEKPSFPKKASTPAISVAEISDASAYSPDVRKIVDTGLDLTTRNLTYKYNSADPKNGGMDCSGFIHYVLTQSGVQNVPRDAREQYAWVRKAGNFQTVLGHSDESFELDGLRPGDLLFWANTSGPSHEPEITQIMIYIGRDKSTNQRLMLGAGEAGTFKGEKKSGVGVFDLKLSPAEQADEEPPTSVFVGYGRFPDLSGN